MGFVGFLNFGLKCIQLLAWPSLTLGYPLYASIRAIETNSKYHMRKLVTYWILFSLISLFELAFVKLIEWIPFWPFLKIIAISCLVLHRFTGAYYAYKWLVRLFLSVNLWQRVQDINWLNKKKELFLMRETFLAAAERYLDENGTEALEKLIASKSNSKALNIAQNDVNAVEHEGNVAATDKIHSNNKAPNVAQNDINAVEHEENVVATDTIQSNCKALNVAQNDINVVEHEENVAPTNNIQSNNKLSNVAQNDINVVELEENVAATDKPSNSKAPNAAKNDINAVEIEENVVTTDKIVKHVDTNLSRTQQKLGTSTEVKELTSTTVKDYVLPVPPTLRIQKDWTCDVCQLKTTCQVTFNSHLQGRKHKSKCEKLKSSMQAMKVEGSSTASNQEPKKDISENRLGQKKTQKTEEKAVDLEENLPATDKISINKVPNVAQNDINTVELEENVAAIDKISNIKAPNVAQNDINTVEHEENVAATDKIQPNNKLPNVAQNDINIVELEENVAATDKVKHVDTNLSRTQQKLGTSTEVKELTSTATVRDYVLPVPPTLRIQKDWTCDVCQHKTMCEVTFNSHLQGRKHKSKCEKLKSSMQAMKVECSSISSNQEPKKDISGNRLGQKKTQKTEEKAMELEENFPATDKISINKVPNVAQNDINAVELEENVAAIDKISNNKEPNLAQNDINAVEPEENVAATNKIVKHVDKNLSRTQQKLGTSAEVKEVTSAATLRDFVLPVPPTLRIQKEWTCAVCQVKTTCEVSLNSHLQGRKHKSKCEKLKSSMQAMKVECSSSTASNQEPKKAVSGNRLRQNKTQEAEEKLKFDVNTEQWKPRKPANVAAAGGIRESKYWFDMHNVSCSGEIDMAAHLNGRRHLSLLNEFDDILRVPNYGAMVPQCLNGLPNYGAVVPQGFNGVPNYGAMVPQAFNGVPNSGAMVPQGFNGVSNYGAMVPQAFKGLEQI